MLRVKEASTNIYGIKNYQNWKKSFSDNTRCLQEFSEKLWLSFLPFAYLSVCKHCWRVWFHFFCLPNPVWWLRCVALVTLLTAWSWKTNLVFYAVLPLSCRNWDLPYATVGGGQGPGSGVIAHTSIFGIDQFEIYFSAKQRLQIQRYCL